MYKIKDFDYDLWTNADGKCFARVRSTGEVCEISSEAMKLLRCEEKRIYRELDLKKSLDSENIEDKTKDSIMYPLSFEINDDENDEDSLWLQSDENLEEEQIARDLEDRILKQLTDYQKEVFLCVMKNGETQESFASRHNITSRGVRRIIEKIQRKAKNFFE